MIPTCYCKAEVDDAVRDAAQAGPLNPGQVIAKWGSGNPIVIKGRYKTRSVYADLFNLQPVRWECPGMQGFFAKGLVDLKRETVENLPLVK